MDSARLDDQQIKHLEMIQAVISRLANNSFLIKGWAVTVVGVFLGFAVDSSDSALAVASVVPTLAFWALDTDFLRSERLFRALFDRVRAVPPGVEPFFMGATSDPFLLNRSRPVRDPICPHGGRRQLDPLWPCSTVGSSRQPLASRWP